MKCPAPTRQLGGATEPTPYLRTRTGPVAPVSGLADTVRSTKARGGNYNKKQHIVYLFVVITPDVFGAAVGAFSTPLHSPTP